MICGLELAILPEQASSKEDKGHVERNNTDQELQEVSSRLTQDVGGCFEFFIITEILYQVKPATHTAKADTSLLDTDDC